MPAWPVCINYPQHLPGVARMPRGFLGWLERLAWRTATLLVLGLLVVQWAMARPDLRAWLSRTDHLESLDAATLLHQVATREPESVQAARPALSSGLQPLLTVVLTNAAAAPNVKIVVGDAVAGDFARGVVMVAVKPGEAICLDARSDQRTLTFQVLASKWVTSPAPQRIATQGTRVLLGTVGLNPSP